MKHRIMDKGGLATELAVLQSLDRKQLLKRWRSLYGMDAPAKISQQLLIQAVACRLQENALGGLKSATLRFLAKAAEDASAGRKITAQLPVIKSGTRLLREWHGVTHEVIILDNNVQYQGKCYRSLSEVARIITGVRWSGPLFFGLKKQEAAA